MSLEPAAPEPVAPSTAAEPAEPAPAPVPAGPATPPVPARPRLTGGQRASAILAGIVGHVLFAIGWFGFGFVLVGALASGIVGALLQALLGPVDSKTLQDILERAGIVVWIVVLIFAVGTVAFMALGIIVSTMILRKGDVNRPVATTWAAVVLAAIADIPAFWIAVLLASMAADSGAGLVVLPPVFALALVIVIGVCLWWWMAHVNRPKAPKPQDGLHPGP